MSLETICELSNFYGANPAFVLAGGGNTSCKDEKYLYIKPSGVALADLKSGDFVKLEREILHRIFELKPIENPAEREAFVTRLLAFAVVSAPEGRRPSVEAPLHELMPFRYVVHLHPAMVNGLTCSLEGEAACARLFPDALWIPETDPGYVLAKTVHEAGQRYEKNNGRAPSLIFLQNHGVFAGANSPDGIEAHYGRIMTTLEEYYRRKKIPLELTLAGEPDASFAFELAPKLRGYLGDGETPVTVKTLPPFQTAKGAMTPDHIVYAKSFALVSENPTPEEIEAFQLKHGYKPLVIEVPGRAVFCAGRDGKNAAMTALLARDAALVQQYTAAFGGARPLSDAGRNFIENWEAETYRRQLSAGAAQSLSGKVAVITGGAQGFGCGIAEELAQAGATVVIADLNSDGAKQAVEKLKAPGGASAVAVNISDEASVEAMIRSIVAEYGGIDLFIANAGVLKAGSVKEFNKTDWDLVTAVNYSGYFLCVKHAARVMSRQNACCRAWTDIVQVNSKSGLAGSNRNAAYAGSKFGTIGLTQSFALELISDHIKVNSICPGNFFDGPLWTDPEKGLFVQYLRSGKVPGATSVDDVKRHYEKQIPMGRGCSPKDVAQAILYAVAQSYETGQAIPVTGGQVMLN